MKYSYQAEKLSVARRALMLPHTAGEAKSISGAFYECSLAFADLDETGLDDGAREWLGMIKGLMDTAGIEDPSGIGTFELKARGLTGDQKLRLSRAVDELASWFQRES
jgi:hypothetical protein